VDEVTSQSPDPQPDETTGLEPGGSVPPGETPPGESSTTSGVSFRESDLPSGSTNKVVYGLIVVSGLLVALMLLAYAVGLIG
jgi:hypothetical protein